MGNLFCSDSKGRKDDGGQKAAPPPKPKRTDDTDRGILQLKTQRDKLQIQRKNVMKMVEQDVEKAKQYLKETPPNKKFAGFCLKKKAHHLKMVENCDNSMMTLLQLIDNVEMARVQAEVVKALEKGNSCLKEMRDEVSVDRVQLLMDETEEFREWNEEINTRMGQLGITDDDIDAQLAAIEEQEQLKHLNTAVKPVPVGAPGGPRAAAVANGAEVDEVAPVEVDEVEVEEDPPARELVAA